MENSLEKAEKLRKRGIVTCLLISALVIGLYFVPYGYYVLYPMWLVYTFVHEMGHGIAAMLIGGEFVKMQMWLDGSGMATNMVPGDASRLSRAFVSFGGLVAPAIVASVCLILGRFPKASRIGLYVFAAISLLSVLLVVRNFFGIFFVLACGAAVFAIAKFTKSDHTPQYTMLFIALTLLTAVFSRGGYLFTDTAMTANGPMPSDVGKISEYLFLPYWFWGGLIGLISVAILVLGILGFFEKPDPKSPPKAIDDPFSRY
ncbi:MAG: M50 family metallopeptidase [Proteobacteria bacterium]|nr:M50 family metallopeptidase [Pseudomonadota bacterium]